MRKSINYPDYFGDPNQRSFNLKVYYKSIWICVSNIPFVNSIFSDFWPIYNLKNIWKNIYSNYQMAHINIFIFHQKVHYFCCWTLLLLTEWPAIRGAINTENFTTPFAFVLTKVGYAMHYAIWGQNLKSIFSKKSKLNHCFVKH